MRVSCAKDRALGWAGKVGYSNGEMRVSGRVVSVSAALHCQSTSETLGGDRTLQRPLRASRCNTNQGRSLVVSVWRRVSVA
jgi:hypothetical protein